ncbi:OLC1v1023972C1 [Oldenlandia corymbosa var. corymbosa]|uniref:OLC1v1023972C1 n=1 Tax=Oldenlandia corymbosa var. corymbosa TaxID=529605 RepID=A0AAV1C1R0_OLDCO|nr:OLC1v1023972C1 [Oldenlandia corymbosa var. corymbosa]
MASGGSSGRANNSGSKGFNFASDDILCSYEDYGNLDGSNGSTHSDPVIGAASAKEFNKNRMARSSAFPATSYSPPEESSFNQDVIVTVEKTMKKYADNLMRFLEGISSRLSQLELYCYNLDKTIGEMRADLVRDNGEADTKLKSLEKHLQEVHRSVQILRDKQELADTQKELAKLQLVQKESSLTSNSQQKEEKASTTGSDTNKNETADAHGQQLALALPQQILQQQHQQQQPPAVAPPAPVPLPSQGMVQSQAYYLTQPQLPTVPAAAPPSQGQYLQPDSQYRVPQMQELSRIAPQASQSQANQTPQVQTMPQYQPQWTPQGPQPVQQLQQPSVQPQMRPSSPSVYPSYLPNQQTPTPPETVPSSMQMQVQYSGISQPGPVRPEGIPYGYGGTVRPAQPQPPPQQIKASYTPPGEGYTAPGPHPTHSPGNAYVMYDEAGRPHHPPQPPHYQQSAYPPTSMPPQNMQPATGSNLVGGRPQIIRNHPYNELIEKLVSMGFRGEHVVGVIQRLEESGQPVDFNAVLDRLNGHSSGGPQRGWSG